MEKVLLKPEVAADALSVSRTTLYELLRRGPERGGIASLRVGTSRRITPEALRDYIARQQAEQAAEVEA